MLIPLFVSWPGRVLLATVMVVMVVSGVRTDPNDPSRTSRAQKFLVSPGSVEVRPGEAVVLPCLVENKGGECRWEKDGLPL